MIKKPLKKLIKLFISTKPKVAHISLNGVIGGGSRFEKGLNLENVFPLLETAFELDGIKAVAISVNSPGGSPVQSELIYNAIRELSAEKKIPVYTFAQDVAASGGYWLLLSGDEIYAHNSSIIGSIGVIFSSFGFVDAIKKLGVERRIYTEGKNKAILDPFLPEESENIEILKNAQRDIFESFKEIVISRRKNKLRSENGQVFYQNFGDNCAKNEQNLDGSFLDNKIFTGAFWSGKTALKLGLIDEIADLRGKMKQKFGPKIKIVNIETKKSFLKSLFSSKNGDFVANLVNEVENKAIFGRFGL